VAGPAIQDTVRAAVERYRVEDARGGLELLEPALGRAAEPGERLEVLRWLAHGHTMDGDPEAAAGRLEQALAIDESDPWLHYALGTARLELGDDGAAEEAYTLALALDPTHVKARQWRGEARSRRGDLAGAIEDLDAAVELIVAADRRSFALWGGDRDGMLRWTLGRRAALHDQLGEAGLAAADRERAAALGR
jgi:tetratricopeptide (TPR) repeat protein